MIDPGATLIVGVETTCDETGCAVVADGRRVLSNAVATQFELHERFGGVVPEIASRAHLESIDTVVAKALADAGVNPDQIAAVAVAHEPGLIGSLLIGLMAAKTLAWVWSKPLIGVNHIHAHAYAPALDDEPIAYPAVALIASGGHTSLYRCDAPADMELLGATIDDAAGEAFDKVAAILHLGHPGGPAIDRAARQGDPKAIEFPRPLLKGQSLDFSFSGIKTAVLYGVHGPGKTSGGLARLSAGDVADICASFQSAVVDVLVAKTMRAVERTGVRTVVVGGGVAANRALRASLQQACEDRGVRLILTPMRYCTDNGAMIAAMGGYLLKAGRVDTLALEARATGEL